MAPLTAKSCVQAVLRDGIRRGQLVIEDCDGTHTYGEYDSSDKKARIVSIKVVNDDFYARVYLRHDLGCTCDFSYCFATRALTFSPSSLRGVHVR